MKSEKQWQVETIQNDVPSPKTGKKLRSAHHKNGFTLAELLIVVAIIAVLTAMAIPVFSSQLESSKQAADLSSIRSAYAEAAGDALTNGGKDGEAETGLMRHTGVFNKLGEATIGNLDLTTNPDANPIVKDYSVIVKVSAEDGSVSLSVGNGGFVLGKAASRAELDHMGNPINDGRLDRIYDKVFINDNKIRLYASSSPGAGGHWYSSEKTIEASYGEPYEFCAEFSNNHTSWINYYKWDGARWYVVRQEGNTWEQAVTES